MHLRLCFLGALCLSLLLLPVGSAHATARVGTDLAVTGPVIGWGSNTRGQLGVNPSTRIARPVPVNDLGYVIALAAGVDHSLALLRDGTVRAWGANDAGQLGDGTTLSRGLPVAVDGLTDIVAIAAGGQFSLALRRNGVVFGWGINNLGQVGTTVPDLCSIRGTVYGCSVLPLPIAGLSTITALSAGGAHGLALRQDGTVMAWGDNRFGQVSRAAVDTCPVAVTLVACSAHPVTVIGLGGVTAIAAGMTHSLALTSDQRVQAWGNNQSGQSGEGADDTCIVRVDTACALRPVTVPGVEGAISIAAGGTHSLVLLQEGHVQAFGYEPELGLGNANPRPHPRAVIVPGLEKAVVIAVGRAFSIVTTADGGVWAWGIDERGQLGYGLESNDPCQIPHCYLVPAPVLTHDLVAVAAGQDFVLAIQRTTLPGLPNTGAGWLFAASQGDTDDRSMLPLHGWLP